MTRYEVVGLAAGVAVLAACSAPSPTQLVVVVASDYAPGDDVARIVVTTEGETGDVIATRDLQVTASGDGDAVTLPFSFGVVPAGDPARPLRIEVGAYADGATAPFVTRRAIAPFVVGETRRLVVYLSRACEGVTCDAASTCVQGACASADVPVTGLDRVTPGGELDVDAGPSDVDAGAPPACLDRPSCDGATHVEVGDGFACAVTRLSGRVVCWGTEAALGQLGDGAATASATPVVVETVSDVRELVTGDAFACATAESQTWCWGDNALGQLGAGDAPSAPTPVELPMAVGRIFAGRATICAAGSTSLCWGAGLPGASLALPDTCGAAPCARRPVEQPRLDQLAWIADEGHTCVVRDGALACAGANGNGEVGDGTRDARDALTPVPGLGIVWSVATTARTTCAVDAMLPEGAEDSMPTLRCWGAGDVGQLARTPDGRCDETPCATSPTTVEGIDDALEVAATGDTFCVRTRAGAVRCWGSDADGGLGDGVGAPDRCMDTTGTTIRCALAPVRVRNVDAIDLDARAGRFCAALRDGGVACWGRGAGELAARVAGLPR